MKTPFILGAAMLAMGGCTVYQTEGPAEQNKTRDLTPICHEGKTLRVEDDVVRDYLNQGASLGQCASPDG
ncbi:MAG: hypothetical protein AAGA23_01630 [Pseudomonadota bacterium]